MNLLVLVPSEREQAGLRSVDLPQETCGVGLVAAAIRATEILARLRPRHVVLVGLAGARVPLAPATLVEGTEVVNEAVGVGSAADFQGLAAMGLGPPDGPPDRLALAPLPGMVSKLAAEGAPDDAIRSGPIGTVATSAADVAEASARTLRSPDVLVEEMEGHAVAVAAAAAGVPLSILRAVSNTAGDRGLASWHVDEALSALAGRLGALAQQVGS